MKFNNRTRLEMFLNVLLDELEKEGSDYDEVSITFCKDGDVVLEDHIPMK